MKKEEPWLKGEESLDDIIDIIHEVAAQMDDYMPLQDGASTKAIIPVKEPEHECDKPAVPAAPSSGSSKDAPSHAVVNHALNRMGTDDIKASVAAKAVDKSFGGLAL